MSPEQEPKALFREVQAFRPLWLWAIVLGTAVVAWDIVLKYPWAHWPFNLPRPDEFHVFLSWAVFGVATPGFFASCRLIVEVHKHGIYVRYFPFQMAARRISFTQFTRYEKLDCRPLYEFGGWGIHDGPKGKAYNMGSDEGVALRLLDGRHVLIGTQRTRELLDALHSQCGGGQEKAEG